MLEYILKTLYTYIQTSIPEVKTIDFFKGGISDIDNGLVSNATFPAVLIEFERFDAISTVGTQSQQLECEVIFHIITDATGGFDMTCEQLDLNLNDTVISDTIFKKLNGIVDKDINLDTALGKYLNISTFVRTYIEFENTVSNLLDSKVAFTFLLTDNTRYQADTEVVIDYVDLTINIETAE